MTVVAVVVVVAVVRSLGVSAAVIFSAGDGVKTKGRLVFERDRKTVHTLKS